MGFSILGNKSEPIRVVATASSEPHPRVGTSLHFGAGHFSLVVVVWWLRRVSWWCGRCVVWSLRCVLVWWLALLIERSEMRKWVW